MPKAHRHRAVSLAYFLFFACSGAFLPYISIYLSQAGWNGVAIGLYAAIGPLVTFVTQPFWGFIGDRWGNIPLLFALLILLTGASIGLFAFLPVSPFFFLLPVLLGLFQGPLSPMIDSLSVRILGENKNTWGTTRLWGSVGFAALSFVMGKLFITNNLLLFVGYGVGAVFTALAVLALPPVEEKRVKQKPTPERFKFQGVGAVLSGPFLSFLAAMFILQLGQYMPSSFLSVVMTDRGASSTLVGLAWSATALVELPVFIGITRQLDQRTPESLLIFAGLFNVGRLALFAFSYSPWLMLVAQSLEGLAYATILVARVLICDRLIPKEYHATGFTLQVAITVTLPTLAGGLLGGHIYDRWGGTALYLACALLTFLGTVAFIVWHRSTQRKSKFPQEGAL